MSMLGLKDKKADCYYAVARGFTQGIFCRWEDCKKAVLHCSYSDYRKMDDISKAVDYLFEHSSGMGTYRLSLGQESKDFAGLNELAEYVSIIEENKSDKEEISSHAESVPIWYKYSLSVEEAAKYFRIGENKLRFLIKQDPSANYLLWNGNRPQIKRVAFEIYLNGQSSI